MEAVLEGRRKNREYADSVASLGVDIKNQTKKSKGRMKKQEMCIINKTKESRRRT